MVSIIRILGRMLLNVLGVIAFVILLSIIVGYTIIIVTALIRTL